MLMSFDGLIGASVSAAVLQRGLLNLVNLEQLLGGQQSFRFPGAAMDAAGGAGAAVDDAGGAADDDDEEDLYS